jgi:hypothetical protein
MEMKISEAVDSGVLLQLRSSNIRTESSTRLLG